jgi:hypothetical protein
LKEVIKFDVMAGKPLTLTSAIRLAQLYEARNTAILRSNSLEVRRTPLDNRQQTDQLDFLIKRLTPAELKERQDKGLCFKCNEKYRPGHRFKMLFMIEVCRGEDGDRDVLMSEEDNGG